MSGSLSDSSALFVSIVLIVSALPILVRYSRESVSWAYALSASLLTLLCLGLWFDDRARFLLLSAWLYWPVAVWWLATVYGRVSRRRRRERGFFVLFLALVLAAAIALLGGSRTTSEWTGHILTWERWAVLLGVGFWLAALVNFLLTMRAAVGQPRLRGAAAIGVFACLLPLWPETVAAASGQLPRYSLWFAAGLGFVAHMFWAEWLVRHRGRESDLEFERPVAYISIAVFLLGVYLLIIGGVGKAVEWLGGDARAFFSALGGVVLAVIGLALATSGRLWQRARDYIDRNFYRGEIDFRAEWMQLSEELAALPDPRDLGRTLARLFAERVRSGQVLIYRRVEDGDLELWARVGSDAQFPDRISGLAPWVDWLWRLGTPAEWRTLATSDQPPEFVDRTDLAAPMVAKQELVAVAVLGDHPGPFSAEERLWLETAGQQAALAVVAAGLTERLIETRELASFHRLSTFVIHDVKNAISMLSLLLQNLESGRGASVDEHVKVTIRQATAKLSALTERFSGSPESLKLDRRACRLGTLAAEVVAGLKGSFPDVHFGLPPDIDAPVYADRDQIARVLENLCINACEAMQGKGSITMRLVVRDPHVELEVADTGPGMDVEFLRERLFRPFATTKKKGLGIGLYQSREITRAHGGQLRARSQVGVGTTMTLVLPRLR
jgi:putative PEP-CTERM system histidine kinase